LPVIQLAVSAPVPPEQLAADVADRLTPRLRDIEGVRDVAVTGAPDQRITIDLDTEALVAAGLDPGAVASVLEDNGVAVPGGTITEDGTTYPVQAGEPITSVDGLASAPVGVDPAGEVVELGDVAEVELGPGPETSYSRLNGEAALAVSITKTPAGNTVDISHEVQAVLDDVRPVLPEGAESAVVFDQAPFIEQSIEGLATEGALGLAFAVLVIAVFLVSL
ncbi:efflux RND transporter permease subunit, partial [Georgenia sp. 10Sc9-8]|nr:efflux RND transporter permease subunit [Georgenia halotolerans]